MTYTFAAPTAGNQAFADWYTNQAFPEHSWRYYNSIDLIPMAWDNLPVMRSLFPSPGPPCPFPVDVIINLVND